LRWLIAALVGTALSLVGFAVAAFIIDYVGRTVFYADVTFEEVVRVLGLASVWTVVGILGSLVGNFDVLVCLTAPFLLLAGILGIASWFIAVKEALDLEWVQTIVTVVIGFIVWMVFIAITGFILGLLGLGARTAGQLIGA
jgi:hypothetical protein